MCAGLPSSVAPGHLLGNTAWCMPKWLDKILPKIQVEGSALNKETAFKDNSELISAEKVKTSRNRSETLVVHPGFSHFSP
ncbi:hypothetical protein AUR04nite_26350 [Glutamicibacter uratoxydans]|uniref:Uncharacterized protein n=1 Tax=Glutamicibacter uratoxydans TaxID=43667 RepID=A0A4Y4DR38_GLUUR|nr:hypothetical protein AUR04nite_26350 [Glutamicibacter uratoxydans]